MTPKQEILAEQSDSQNYIIHVGVVSVKCATNRIKGIVLMIVTTLGKAYKKGRYVSAKRLTVCGSDMPRCSITKEDNKRTLSSTM